MSTVSRKIVLVFSSNILIKIFGLISLIFIQRYYGYEILGLIGFSLAIVSSFNILSDLGLETAHKKRFNEKDVNEKKSIGTFLVAKIILNFVMLLSLLTFIFIFRDNTNFFPNDLTIIFILLLSLRFLIDNFIAVFKTIFLAKLNVSLLIYARLFFRFLQMVLKVFIAYLTLNVLYIVGVEIIAGFLILVTTYLFSAKINFSFPSRKYIKSYSSFALQTVLISFFLMLISSTDRIMLQYFSGPEAVGIYFLPAFFQAFFLMASNSLISLLFPLSSRLHSEGNIRKINTIVDKSVKFLSIVCSPVALFLFVYSSETLSLLFGSESKASAYVFQILIIVYYSNTLRHPYRTQLVSSGNLSNVSFAIFTAFLLNIVLNLFLIPDKLFGYELLGLSYVGASYSTLLTFLYLFAISTFFVKKLLGLSFYSRIYLHFISIFITYFVLSSLKLIFDLGEILFLIYLPVSFLLFYISLYTMREFTKEDYYFIIDNISPYKLFETSKNDIENT